MRLRGGTLWFRRKLLDVNLNRLDEWRVRVSWHRPSRGIIFLNKLASLIGNCVSNCRQVFPENDKNSEGVNQAKLSSINAVFDDTEQITVRDPFPGMIGRPDCKSNLPTVYGLEGLIFFASDWCARFPGRTSYLFETVLEDRSWKRFQPNPFTRTLT